MFFPILLYTGIPSGIILQITETTPLPTDTKVIHKNFCWNNIIRILKALPNVIIENIET
jgi:hypothetical protein